MADEKLVYEIGTREKFDCTVKSCPSYPDCLLVHGNIKYNPKIEAPKDHMVPCPIVNQMIDCFDCMVASDDVSGHYDGMSVREDIRAVEGWQDICTSCGLHYFDCQGWIAEREKLTQTRMFD